MNEETTARLALYRRTARALDAFFLRFTSPCCRDCLALTRRHHADDPRADVELVSGVFPGCCHAGVGDALWVPRSGDEGRFSAELAEALAEARAALGPPPQRPLEYEAKERGTGRVVRGVACLHLGPDGCRLGDLKAPLCVAYLCEPVREALENVVGPGRLGSDTDDFCGVLAVLRSVVGGNPNVAVREVEALERRLCSLARRLAAGESVREDRR